MTWSDKIEHLVFALAIQLAVVGGALVWHGAAGPAWWIGAAAACGVFYGREEAQAERKAGTAGLRICWRCFLPWAWSRDGLVDFLVPAAAVVALALLLG